MKKLHKLSLCVCAALCLASCDDYLDIKPKGIKIPETSADYERLLNYKTLQKSVDIYSVYMSDDVWLADDGVYGNFVSKKLYVKNLYTFNSEVFGDGETDHFWEDCYKHIYYYNVIADEVMGAADDTEEHKRQLRAEALLGRAYEYLTLVNGYANHYDPKTAATDPGVPLQLDQDLNKENLQRASVQEVYDQIKRDLEEAAPNLPDKPALNAFRASKPVGYGILARMYLYMGDYEKALKNAEISLQHNSTLLNLLNYEVVDSMQAIGRINVPEAIPTTQKPINPENIYIRMPYMEMGVTGEVFISEEFDSLFDHKNDQRYLLYISDKMRGKQLEASLWMPYLRVNIALATPEIYLIAAECEARIGNKDKAMEYINKLRDNRIFNNVPLTAATNQEALKLVLDERRRELPMLGGIRLSDLKRLNREPEFAKTIVHEVNGQKYVLEPNNPKYILPIPPKVLRFNPGMTPNLR